LREVNRVADEKLLEIKRVIEGFNSRLIELIEKEGSLGVSINVRGKRRQPMVIRYYQLIKDMKNSYNLHREMVASALRNGVSKTARYSEVIWNDKEDSV